jgi:hypothetical protein
MEMQTIGSHSLDESFLGKLIEYLAEFDMDEVVPREKFIGVVESFKKYVMVRGRYKVKGEGNAIRKTKQQSCFGMPFQMLKWKRIAQSSLSWQRSGMGIVLVHGG